MGLSKLKVPTVEVEVPHAGTFTVRGLSFADVQILLGKHADQMGELFEMFKSETNIVENAGMVSAIFIQQAPALAADAIALASGEPDSFNVALMLPFPVQVEALRQIATLTFTSEDSLKKFLATVREGTKLMLSPSS